MPYSLSPAEIARAAIHNNQITSASCIDSGRAASTHAPGSDRKSCCRLRPVRNRTNKTMRVTIPLQKRIIARAPNTIIHAMSVIECVAGADCNMNADPGP